MRRLPALLALLLAAVPAAAQTPSAVVADPPEDAANPPRMEVLHIPSGGVAINGVAYAAAGPGAHPAVVLLHGLPGNEKNLDLAQAIRRAGWTAVTFNYRGSWGSPGRYSFAGNLADTRAVLAYVRAHAAALGIDARRIVLGGHSMGGWATALVAARDPGLAGAFLISAGDMGRMGGLPHDKLVAELAADSETLAATPQAMAAEIEANAGAFAMPAAAPGLVRLPLLALTSDDGLAPHTDALVAAIRAAGGARVSTVHVATDHGWSGKRIRLESEVVAWLAALPPSR